jgi:hypothetical protein
LIFCFFIVFNLLSFLKIGFYGNGQTMSRIENRDAL